MKKHNFKIEQARPSDFDELKSLLDRANQYSIERSGLKLWTMMDYVYGQLQKQINDGECYVLRNRAGNITSCIVLTDDGSEWGEREHDSDALYFHKWMKDPGLADSSEPKKLLRFAAEEAIRQKKSYLRCDTVPSLIKLLKYYDRLGFKRIALFVYESSGRPGILLEVKPDLLLKNL